MIPRRLAWAEVYFVVAVNFLFRTISFQIRTGRRRVLSAHSTTDLTFMSSNRTWIKLGPLLFPVPNPKIWGSDHETRTHLICSGTVTALGWSSGLALSSTSGHQTSSYSSLTESPTKNGILSTICQDGTRSPEAWAKKFPRARRGAPAIPVITSIIQTCSMQVGSFYFATPAKKETPWETPLLCRNLGFSGDKLSDPREDPEHCTS